MNKKWHCFLGLFYLLLVNCNCLALTIDSLNYGLFGKVKLYIPSQKPNSVVLFVSGDGGWQYGVINMAKNIANQGALVLGIDAKDYVKALSRISRECYYPAADFEMLSLSVQRKYNFPIYIKPVLIGYSFGATLVYGILAQAPANTFKGAIALGFSPDLDISKPLCKGMGLTYHVLKKGKTYYFEQTKGLTAPFIALHGMKDLSCSYAVTRDFLKDVPRAKLVTLPKVGHGFSIADNWLPAFNSAFKSIVLAPSYLQVKPAGTSAVNTQKNTPLPGDIPLIPIPSTQKNDFPLVFFVSGDGGWTSFDQSLALSIAEKGFSVVGLDAQKYFWKEKSPERTTVDISKAITHFMGQWNKKSFILVGFSFGASITPFVANRLAPDLKSKLKKVYSISPDENADFEIRVIDMLNLRKSIGDYSVLNELIGIKSIDPICIFGKEEDDDFKAKLIKEGFRTITLPGGHHFDNNFAALARIITSEQK